MTRKEKQVVTNQIMREKKIQRNREHYNVSHTCNSVLLENRR